MSKSLSMLCCTRREGVSRSPLWTRPRSIDWAIPGRHLKRQISHSDSQLAWNAFRTIETSVRVGELNQLSVGVGARLENEHAGIEAVGPSDVGSSWELVALEELVAVLKNLKMKLKLSRNFISRQFQISPKHQRRGRRTSRTEWDSSSGASWRWCRARGASARPGWRRLSSPVRRPVARRQTQLPASSSSALWRRVWWEPRVGAASRPASTSAPPPGRPTSTSHLWLKSPTRILKRNGILNYQWHRHESSPPTRRVGWMKTLEQQQVGVDPTFSK